VGQGVVVVGTGVVVTIRQHAATEQPYVPEQTTFSALAIRTRLTGQ